MLWVVVSPHLPHQDSTSAPTPSFAVGGAPLVRPGDAGDAALVGRAAAGRAIGRALGRDGGGNLGQQRRQALEIDHPPAERALGAHLLAGRQRLQQLAVAPRQALDAGVRRGHDVALVLALLGQVHLQGDVANLVVQLVQGGRRVGSVHGRTISHARPPRARGALTAPGPAVRRAGGHFTDRPAPGSVARTCALRPASPGERRRAGRRCLALAADALARRRPTTSRCPRRWAGRRDAAAARDSTAPPPPPAPRRRPAAAAAAARAAGPERGRRRLRPPGARLQRRGALEATASPAGDRPGGAADDDPIRSCRRWSGRSASTTCRPPRSGRPGTSASASTASTSAPANFLVEGADAHRTRTPASPAPSRSASRRTSRSSFSARIISSSNRNAARRRSRTAATRS